MKLNNSIVVNDFLKRENNNLDLFRVVAALLVIVGHSYALFPSVGEVDQVRSFTGFTHTHTLAVKVFFFISGLVVTNSILSSKSFVHFTISRTFRIFPGLIFLCVATAFIIGPLLTGTDTNSYFMSAATYDYVTDNVRFKTNYALPSMFEANTYPRVVNGSLWTLPEELGCYLFLLAVFSIGLLKNRMIGTLLFLLLVVDVLLPQRHFLYWKANDPDIYLLSVSFATGAILALRKEQISINWLQTIGFAILTYILWGTRFVDFVFLLTVFSLVLNLSASDFIRRFKIKNDISYGIYLWGFLVQQCVEQFITGQTVYLKMFISGIIAMGLGALSWYLIEKPSIRFGKQLIERLRWSGQGTNEGKRGWKRWLNPAG